MSCRQNKPTVRHDPIHNPCWQAPLTCCEQDGKWRAQRTIVPIGGQLTAL
jgi:hypothetical protein